MSILGGFLLTLGLTRAADKKRLERSMARARSLHAEIEKEIKDDRTKVDEAEREHTDRLLSIRLRSLRGQLNGERERIEREQADRLLESLRQEGLVRSDRRLERLTAAREEIEQIGFQIDVRSFEIAVIAVGTGLLFGLGFIGVGIPLYIMPVESHEQHSTAGWIAQRGTIVLLGVLIVFVQSIFILGEVRTYFTNMVERVTVVLAALLVAVWLLWPNANDRYFLYASHAIFLIGIIVRGVVTFWSKSRLLPPETRTDGLRIRHRKRTNLLR